MIGSYPASGSSSRTAEISSAKLPPNSMKVREVYQVTERGRLTGAMSATVGLARVDRGQARLQRLKHQFTLGSFSLRTRARDGEGFAFGAHLVITSR